MLEAKIGVIGGSGLYEISGLTDVQEVNPDTPFGKPSDIITTGKLGGVSLAFLPRHGRGHRLTPTEVPYRANIYALKSLGIEWIIAVNAVGSLKADIKPGDIVIPDQIIDRTRQRVGTFFGNGIVAHILFAQPFCRELCDVLYQTAKEVSPRVHRGGTYVVMEGPALSTQAESRLHRSWGASLIGMTAMPEAKLAREAEICYSILAGVTDVDCWQESIEPTPIEEIVANLQKNIGNIREIVKRASQKIVRERKCSCTNALENAIVTDPRLIPPELKEKLGLLIGKYVR
jgi:5'-methylthioadenosine phosphorylase